ncbi:hypothetical protein JTB14_001402 [Gonioctena quinquepunctata]|nr:hypothetical protein JTB14_001402 [Gonioctena quinquepunctata]
MSRITRASASTASSNIDETTLEMIINKLAPKITSKIEEQLEKLSKQFEKMDTKLNNVAIKLNVLDELAHSYQKEVSLLRNELDSFEQTNKMNTLRLVGMKEDVNENLQDSLRETAIYILNTVSFVVILQYKSQSNDSDPPGLEAVSDQHVLPISTEAMGST